MKQREKQHTHTHTHTHIYIYIERERERERYLMTSLSLSTSLTSAKKALRSKSSSAMLLVSPILSTELIDFPQSPIPYPQILSFNNPSLSLETTIKSRVYDTSFFHLFLLQVLQNLLGGLNDGVFLVFTFPFLFILHPPFYLYFLCWNIGSLDTGHRVLLALLYEIN